MKPYLYITVPYTVVRQQSVLEGSPGSGINILLDADDIDMATVLNATVARNTPFIVSIAESMLGDSESEVLYHKLYLLLALSGSFGDAQTDIPVFASGKNFNPEKLHKLKHFFTEQGEHTINFIIAAPGTNGVLKNIIFCNRMHIASLSDEQLQKYLTYPVKQVIVRQEVEAADSTTVAEALEQNKYAAMLFAFIARNSDAETYRRQAHLWQQRSMLYLNFIQLGKRISQDEYYGLKHWYTKEYEVLPLWYKRFGHIIKVFMGKRSFKSLFIDQKT